MSTAIKHPITHTGLMIEGAEVLYVQEHRLPVEERYDDLYYYAMRHDDDGNWSEPVSIENAVWANFFGVLATDKPIPSLTPTEDKPKDYWYRIPIHPDEEPDNKYIQEAIMHILSCNKEALAECLKEHEKEINEGVLKCMHCEHSSIKHVIYKGTHIYICNECPDVTFEYSTQKDIDHLNEYLNRKEEL